MSVPRIRVLITGDHSWEGHTGWIEPVDGKYDMIQVLGLPPTLYKVTLDNGHQCYAARAYMQTIRQEPVDN